MRSSSSLDSPMGQSVLMGVIFLFVFAAYITIQGFASKLFGEELAGNVMTVLYATFTIFCFVSPTVTSVLGARATLAVGILGYGALVAASLLYSIVHTEWAKAVVILGGAILGMGAACLWTAQGRLLLEWADGENQGTLFGVFWALFNLSALAGGLLTFFYFSSTDGTGGWPLYAIFLGLISAGALATKLLSKPPPRSLPVGVAVAPTASEAEAEEAPSPVAHARATLSAFGSRRMLRLAPLFFYTGLNQPYQLDGFGDRAFTPSALGIELALFYGAEIIGGLIAGHMLDSAAPAARRRAAQRTLVLFVLFTATGYAFALSSELPAALAHGGSLNMTSLDQVAIVPRSAAFLFWGLSDSQLSLTYGFSVLGVAVAWLELPTTHGGKACCLREGAAGEAIGERLLEE